MRIAFLGGTVVEGAGADPVEVRGAQPALVLAHLVLERPRPLLREELVELLWPGELPAHWEGAARQVVSRVRRALVAAGLTPGSLSSEGGVTALGVPGPGRDRGPLRRRPEALALSRAEVPPESVLAAQLGLVEDLLELGDRARADESLEAATRVAADLDHPYWSWATACWRTLTAIIDGRCDDAEALAFAALECQSGDHPEAVAALGVNLVDIRLFQGRAGEVLDLLRTAAADNPSVPTYRAVLALCQAEAGELEEAVESYDFFAGRGFALPADSNWLLAVAVLGDVCATLGDQQGAKPLIALLEPWADRQVILNCYGGGGAYWGPVAHHLGRLAAIQGDLPRARRLLGQAVELADDLRAPLFAARSRAALTRLA